MEKHITVNGAAISYRVLGEGKTVVLLHGFGEASDIFDGQVEYLQNHCRLIIPDLPGSGKSSLVDDMSIEGMASVIHSILMQEGVSEEKKAIIIGHSMGGYITLALGESNPGLFAGMGIFHSSAYADSEEKKETRRRAISFITEHGAYEFLKTATPKLFSEASKTAIPGKISELIEKGNNFSAQALVSYYEAMMKRPDRTNVLKIMKVPILFILGKYDSAVPLQDGLSLCHLPDLSYIHILHQSGHMGMLEEADRTNRILYEFISGI